MWSPGWTWSWIGLSLTVTDVSTTCSLVIFSVKVSCITLTITTAPVGETSGTLNNSPIQDYAHPGDHIPPELTPQFKSFSNKRDTYPIISLPPQSVQLLLLLGVSYVVEPIWPSITATINSKASSSVNVPNTMKATCLKKKEIKKTMWFNRYLEICCT